MLARTVNSQHRVDPSAHRTTLRWLALAAALAANLVVLYVPDPGTPSTSVPGLDKAVHLAVFLALTLAGLRVGLAKGWFLAAVLTHAVVSEVVQATLLPARSGDLLDLVADAAGITLGYLAHRRWPVRPPPAGRASGR